MTKEFLSWVYLSSMTLHVCTHSCSLVKKTKTKMKDRKLGMLRSDDQCLRQITCCSVRNRG